MSTLAIAAMASPLPVVLVLVLGVLGLVWLVFIFSYGFLWLQALLGGARVSVTQIIGMRLRGIKPKVIIQCRVMAMQAGIALETEALEAHYMAKGDVLKVTRALIAAGKAGVPLSFDKACALDLMGKDVMQAAAAHVEEQQAQP